MPFKRRNYNQPSSGVSLPDAWSTGSWPTGQRQPKAGWSWDATYKDGPCKVYSPAEVRRVNQWLKANPDKTVAEYSSEVE